MKKNDLIDIYLQNYSVGDKWRLTAKNTDDISQIVVIPAFAEKELLFSTLASLAQNPPSSLEQTFVVCVINNLENSSADVKENNLQTLEVLDALISGKSLKAYRADRALYSLLSETVDSRMRLGYIDAASEGLAMPLNTGGVGLARKIGMDMAVRLLKKNSNPRNLILSLDADTLVQKNYLPAISNYFLQEIKTAVVAYEHQLPHDSDIQAAICCYEIFLRYWVLGLKYAKSPWAFHSIGSTIVTSVEAYLEVRGMNKRRAGEDFYFLNKLAKIGNIGFIGETRVFPSPRSSFRVPFGTGKRIQRFLSGDRDEEYRLYDPRIFSILEKWLRLMDDIITQNETDIMTQAGMIHPGLKTFLSDSDFPGVWSKIHRRTKNEKTLFRQFHDWFDGFKTLKMINYFTREIYPQIDMFPALDELLTILALTGLLINKDQKIPALGKQMEILHYLRSVTL